MITHGKAFRAYGFTHVSRIIFGKRSVADNEVSIKAKRKRDKFILSGLEMKNQIHMPIMATMKVGDSALWLKMIIQINTEARARVLNVDSEYFFVKINGIMNKIIPGIRTRFLLMSR